ncbi:hypothetical protein [Actinomadura sp. 3N407]|uniref:hypothetical protein n=1 Tax=Actinomadura sp. 3N407 TaxID=3457423 RepID=UPI003FCE53E7
MSRLANGQMGSGSSASGAAFQLARLVAVVVSVGFSFGGFIGITDSDAPGWRKGVAAAVLLLVRPPALAWTGVSLVVVLQFLSGLSVRPTAWEAFYLAAGHAAFVGIALYGVARLADLVADLHNTRDDPAAAEVARERLAFAERLHGRIGTSLREIVRSGEAIGRAAEPESARERLDAGLQTARTALHEARSVAHGYHGGGPAGRRPVADDLTTTAVGVLTVATICLMIVPAPVRQVAEADVSGADRPGPDLLPGLGLPVAGAQAG